MFLNSRFISCRSLLYIAILLLPAGVHAQSVDWATTCAHTSNTSISSLSVRDNGDIHILSVQHVLFPLSAGTAVIAVYHPDGALRWSADIGGQIFASDMLLHGDRFWICGHIDTTLTYDGDTFVGQGFFMMQCAADGALQWMVVLDSLEGHNSRMTLSPEGLPVVSAFGEWFGYSALMSFDTHGEMTRFRRLEQALVSDLAFTGNDELIICGSAFMANGFDDVVIDTFISYPNYIAAFDQDWKARWVHVSEYITFDYHHRLAVSGDRVYFFEHAGNPNEIHPTISAFDHDGNLLSTLTRTSLSFIQAELEIMDEDLIVWHDTWNFSNPLIPDSMLLVSLDKDLNTRWELQVTGHIPQYVHGFSQLRAYQLAVEDCHVLLGILPERSTMRFGDHEVLADHDMRPYLVVNLDIHTLACTPSGVGKIPQAGDFTCFPNPVDGTLHLTYSGTPQDVRIVDTHGRVVVTVPPDQAQTDVSALAPGMYVVVVRYANDSAYRRIVVAR